MYSFLFRFNLSLDAYHAPALAVKHFAHFGDENRGDAICSIASELDCAINSARRASRRQTRNVELVFINKFKRLHCHAIIFEIMEN